LVALALVVLAEVRGAQPKRVAGPLVLASPPLAQASA
jgi:hypothetical protein